MRERGILFSAPMVRAILDGSKTQTRRAVKPQPMHTSALPTPVIEGPAPGHKVEGMVWFRFPKARWNSPCSESELAQLMADACPYGAPGDRLWVRETWGLILGGTFYRGKAPKRLSDIHVPGPFSANDVFYRADWNGDEARCFWRPSLLMPRWASRITLEITDVRVERLQSITDADIRAEGVTPEAVKELCGLPDEIHPEVLSPIDQWRWGWEGINGVGSWDANPWLWCLSFRRVS